MRNRPGPDKIALILRDFQADLDAGLNVNRKASPNPFLRASRPFL
ncbi:MAG: hypothetical protein ABI353_20140 [Isosphaeraceae bacterium]